MIIQATFRHLMHFEYKSLVINDIHKDHFNKIQDLIFSQGTWLSTLHCALVSSFVRSFVRTSVTIQEIKEYEISDDSSKRTMKIQ